MQPFIVPLSDLPSGKTLLRWHAEGQFFSAFENSEILDADLVVGVKVEKSGRYAGVEMDVEGTVVVECDRCLGDLELPVSVHPSFSIKFGEATEEPSSAFEGEKEILMLSESDADLDLRQVIYDYVCTSLPLTRVHPEGECDPETVKYLHSEDEDLPGETAEPVSNPFAALKDLLK